MIREPTVGMRVRFISVILRDGTRRISNISIGDTGTITRIDSDGAHKIQMDKEDDYHFAHMDTLTEIKESDMVKLETQIFVCNGCKARKCVRSVIGPTLDIISDKTCEQCDSKTNWVRVYNYELHGEKQIREVTMLDLEEKYGCRVKIVKE